MTFADMPVLPQPDREEQPSRQRQPPLALRNLQSFPRSDSAYCAQGRDRTALLSAVIRDRSPDGLSTDSVCSTNLISPTQKMLGYTVR